jgi:hypothetical protein
VRDRLRPELRLAGGAARRRRNFSPHGYLAAPATIYLKTVVAVRASLAGYLTERQGAPACGPVSGAVAVSVSSCLETCLTLT